MKKIIKYLLITLALLSLFTVVTYRNRILLCINIVKKYVQQENSLETLGTLHSTKNIEFLDNDSYEEVVYKNTNNKELTLDIYPSLKNTDKPSPVIMYVHGGSWIYGVDSIPKNLSPILDIFREEGYTIISVSYEIDPNSIDFQKQISDVKDSIRWVHKNGEEYNLNTNEIGVFGISSGAHLALMATYSDDEEFKDDESLSSYPSTVKYVLDCFGPTNLSTLNPTNIDAHLSSVFNSIENKDELSEKYSPLNHIKSNLPPTMIIHSKADTLVPYSNSYDLYNLSKSYNNQVELVTLKKLEHNMKNFNHEDELTISLNVLKFVVFNSPLK